MQKKIRYMIILRDYIDLSCDTVYLMYTRKLL